MISTLAKAMSDIADELPQVEIAANLYASPRMKQAVTNLYAYIIKFLLRAFDWYRERPSWHMIHAITRPAEVRYKDLILKIKECSMTIARLATLEQQLELRAMHKKIEVMNVTVCLLG